MTTEIISGCGCCGTIVGRISLCDLQNIFIKLYTQASSVAISRNLGGYPSTYVRINIDNTGSITESAWQSGSLAAFISWIQINYPNTQGKIATKSLTDYVFNMEDWIYDSYRIIYSDLQPPSGSILIIINTMDSSVHYSSDYSGYPFTTAGTDRPTPVITNNLQLYEYDCDLYNNIVNQTGAIIAMGDIIGVGGSYSLAQKTNQIKNTSSNKWPINTGGFRATAWAGGVSCDPAIADLEPSCAQGIEEVKAYDMNGQEIPNADALYARTSTGSATSYTKINNINALLTFHLISKIGPFGNQIWVSNEATLQIQQCDLFNDLVFGRYLRCKGSPSFAFFQETPYGPNPFWLIQFFSTNFGNDYAVLPNIGSVIDGKIKIKCNVSVPLGDNTCWQPNNLGTFDWTCPVINNFGGYFPTKWALGNSSFGAAASGPVNVQMTYDIGV